MHNYISVLCILFYIFIKVQILSHLVCDSQLNKYLILYMDTLIMKLIIFQFIMAVKLIFNVLGTVQLLSSLSIRKTKIKLMGYGTAT